MTALLTTTGGRAALLVGLLLVASVAWWLGARRSGVVRASRSTGGTTAPPRGSGPLLAAVHAQGTTLGASATFVQVSSEVCTPCRRTAAVLATLVAQTPGVHHVELDAARHRELTRELGILRTPTVLVLDAGGRELGRSSGAMTPAQARAALDLVAGLRERDALPTMSATDSAVRLRPTEEARP